MMNVIINADDLGISNEVNDATFDLMGKRIVTSATILANAPSVREAIEGSKRFPACSFGVHLDLTEFRPLSRHEGLKELLREDGQFSGMLERTPNRIKKTTALLSGIADEWSRQIDRLQEAGVRISHLDSHQHVHTIPFVFPVLKYIQAKYGIRKVRSTRNVFQTGKRPSTVTLWGKRVYEFCLANLYATKITHAFMDFSTFHEQAVLGKKEWSSAEVMVHPGSREALEENTLLVSDWKELLFGRLQLISYNEL